MRGTTESPPNEEYRPGYDYRRYDAERDRTVSLRPATLERDFGRLHAWLGYDHVKPYWQLDLPPSEFRERLAEKLSDDHLTPYVGCLDHVPMSYWECYRAADDDVANHYDARPSDRGVHLLIGPPEYLGHGYALPLLRAAVAMQFENSDAERVIAEPDARNERVIRVFERCGFESEKQFHFEEAGKDAVLMVCERERFETDVLGAETDRKARATEVRE
ncbi:siderophore biosynthesis protein [Halogeometricum pallidum JCM 14848]|uniref:Siderophore biosynthesis protein n=1 Tax=Halogeometricum pallidum JCM 14848 TaxID=1227487 RepID=M0DBJ0_HALPD|nr:GNAT family N-acetyltransferase [Halogeometricum pallidum]ELZ31524.1 siderophore biosynthesis protein [Halogeometricum pallidum JCM 14848]